MPISPLVQIGDDEVDINNPADVLIALKKAKLVVVSGGAVETTGFGDEQTTWQRSNVSALNALIAEYQAEADLASPPAKRRRFAKAARF